jgi:hypothetical protein
MAKNTEAKREAFHRLATKRTNEVLKRLRILGHCANPQLYEYTDGEVKKIFQAIDKELKVVKMKFQNSGRAEFRL